MEGNFCSRCERRLGAEVLTCPSRKKGDCPYVLKTIPRSVDSNIPKSLILVGLVIIIGTLLFARPKDYTTSFPVILEIITITIMFLIGLIALGIGWFALRSRRVVAFDPLNKDTWERHLIGRLELYSTVITNWVEIDWILKFKSVPPLLSIALNKNQPEYLREPNGITAVIMDLAMQGYVKLFIAQTYTVNAQDLDSINDRKKLFLSVRKGLPDNAAPTETALYNSICKLERTNGSMLPILVDEVLENYFNFINNESSIQYEINVSEETLKELPKIYSENKSLLKQEHRTLLEQEIRLTVNAVRANNPAHPTFWQNLLTYKTLRIIIVSLAFFGFIILRFYLPLYRAEQIVDHVDTEKIVEVVKDSAETVSTTKKELIAKLNQYFNSNDPEYQLLGLSILKDLANDKKVLAYKDSLLKNLKSASIDLQLSALGVLEDLDTKAQFAGEALISLLENEEAKVRAKAAEVLGISEYNPDRSIPKLSELKTDPNSLVRSAALQAIRDLQLVASIEARN